MPEWGTYDLRGRESPCFGDVAAEAGVSTRVLRYYEQQRLLTSTRTPAGHRQYERSAERSGTQSLHLTLVSGLSVWSHRQGADAAKRRRPWDVFQEMAMSEAFGFREFGGPQVQEFFDRPDPVPSPSEVLVRVTVASVNPLDYKLRSGIAPQYFAGRTFPHVLGAEAAGVVVAVGSEVEGLEVGDTVFGFSLTGAGTYARTTLLDGANTARKPEGLRDDWAATIPVAATTALDAVDQLDLPGGATVLINGVGGGVGIATAQVARDRGLNVIGTGSTAKRALAEAVGVTFVDYTDGDVVAQVRELAPDGVDGLVDLVGGKSLRTVAPLAGDPNEGGVRRRPDGVRARWRDGAPPRGPGRPGTCGRTHGGGTS